MTDQLDLAFAAVRKLDPVRQEEIAAMLLSLAADSEEPEDIDPEHLPHVLEGLAQAERGEFVSDKDIAATFARFLNR